MTAITAALVKELRERTGAGMMECKKALGEAGGDIEVAITEMRKSGSLKAAKRAGKIAAEGLIVMAQSDDNNTAVIVEINTETDFSAKDESVRQFADKVAAAALANQCADVDALSAASFEGEETVEAARTALVAKVGENIQLRRVSLQKADGGVVGVYLHGAKIGVLATLEGGDIEVAKDIAMHIAASNPKAITADDIPAELVAKEKEIYISQASESGKPAEIVEKMIQGKLNKFLKEQSLLGQAFVKDPNQSVADLLKAAKATVKAFVRYEVGEGIEKKEDNFAAEVMAQVQGG